MTRRRRPVLSPEARLQIQRRVGAWALAYLHQILDHPAIPDGALPDAVVAHLTAAISLLTEASASTERHALDDRVD